MAPRERPKAWLPAEYTVQQARAIKAVAQGNASDREQRLAMDWLVTQACGTYEQSFRSDGEGGDRETTFAEGRRFVGLQLVKLANMDERVLTAMDKAEERRNG